MSRLLARNAVKIRLWNNKMITSNTYRALILFYKLIHRVDLIKSTVSPILEMRKLNSERINNNNSTNKWHNQNLNHYIN